MGEGRQALAVAGQLGPILAQSTAQYDRFAVAYLSAHCLAAQGLTDPHVTAVSALQDLLRPDGPRTLPPLYQVPSFTSLALPQSRAGNLSAAEQRIAQADAVVPAVSRDKLKAESAGLAAARGLLLQARGRHAEALPALGGRCSAPQPAAPFASISGLNFPRSFVAMGNKAEAIALMQATAARFADSLVEDAPNIRRPRQLLQDLQSPGYR